MNLTKKQLDELGAIADFEVSLEDFQNFSLFPFLRKVENCPIDFRRIELEFGDFKQLVKTKSSDLIQKNTDNHQNSYQENLLNDLRKQIRERQREKSKK